MAPAQPKHHAGSAGGSRLRPGMRQPVGAGAGLNEVPAEGEPFDDRVKTPGCYGWQVDGLTFSYVIVVNAVLHPQP